MSGASTATPRRYEVLDALRGLCALCVCLFHFDAAGPITPLPFIRGSWMFVDFFFVLSGFVIAANYRSRLSEGGFTMRFAVLRFGRVWPLHIAVLAVLIGFELLGLLMDQLGLMKRAPFAGPTAPEAILTNVLLIQSFGLHSGLTWNQPAWSIAAEFWTYLIFAALAVVADKKLDVALIGIIILAPIALLLVSPHGINVTHDWSVIRCLYGFALGALAWRGWSSFGKTPIISEPHKSIGLATFVEAVMLLLVIVFVSTGGDAPFNIAAPLVFTAAILIFAAEAGLVSRLLKRRVFVMLGTLSYSIYMVHSLVQARLGDVLQVSDKLLFTSFVSVGTRSDGRPLEIFGTTPLQGLAFTVLMLVLVIITSWCTWRLVEQPGQRAARRIADSMPRRHAH